MDPLAILLVVAIIAGMYLAFNIGANDVANAMGTSVGSGAFTIKQAIVAAAVCEFLGALLIGDEVSRTIKQGFVGPGMFAADPEGFAYGMTAAILATSLWLQYATFKGLPVSTTHSIVGAVLGFAIMQGGLFEIEYGKLLAIFSSWLISPVLGGLIAYLSLRFILVTIIDSRDPIGRAQKFVPIMIGVAVTILSSAFTRKLLNRWLPIEINGLGLVLALFFGVVIFLIFRKYARQIYETSTDREKILSKTEVIFSRMQWVTACFLAFAHGSNDVANAIGPAAAVISALTESTVGEETAVPTWLLLFGGVGIVVGLAVFGRKVIQTVGQDITEITPSRGFAAEIRGGPYHFVRHHHGLAFINHAHFSGFCGWRWLRPRPRRH